MADNLTISFRLVANDAKDAAHLMFSSAREHDTDGRDCWCDPTFYRICDECEDGCWRCDNGRNEIPRAEAQFCEEPLLVVHRG